MTDTILNPADPPARQIEKLLAISRVLMRRVEQITDDGGAAYAQFQRAAMLEDQVRERTRELERALDLLNASNAALEDANRETERARQNLADAIETVQEGFALFGPDDVLVMSNSRFCVHLADVRPHLAPGLSFAAYVDLVSRSADLDLPEGETPGNWAVQRLRRHMDQHVIVNVRMRRDHWVQVSEHRTADGGTVVLQTDVTDLIRLERQERGRLLDDQERLVRATLDHINQGVAIFDAGRRLVGWNTRLGVLLALPMVRMRVGAEFDTLFDDLARQFRFGEAMTADRLATWVDGRKGRSPLSFELRRDPGLILDVFAQEMPDQTKPDQNKSDQTKPDKGFLFSFTDVTAERRAVEDMARAKETLEARVVERTLDLEDALAQAERANASRSRFVAAASHDLLQPLSAAKLFLSSVPETGVPAPVAEALAKAQNALVSVEGILAALLDISRLESGKAAVTVAPVRMGRLLGQLAEEFAPMAAAKGLRLTFRPCEAVVLSDPGYLRRILQNLIGNAVRYTERGRILVAARPRGRMLRLEVWDTGPGIPEEEQDNIFKEFHRVAARASASEGLGLGLAIVDRASALLGHPLGLSSRPGHGTVFMLQVPLADAGLAPEPLSQGSSAVGPVEGRIVLLVENDAELRRAMVLLLEKWGVAVIEAASGEEALALLDDLGILPDAVIADHGLGEAMTGLDLLCHLQARAPGLPARLISADRGEGLRQAAGAAGVGFMMKPVEADALRAFLAQTPPAPLPATTTKGE
ncbi:PAS-domain containing protein [Tabrizicola oligotrophica]|uniref:histidine kinase n=1 Tax=Tabrizicola oligotrophica TaxID=2710650 RepID=A0A6M0QP22_9RHOB|nr:PAS-domain containing protein [Tabrizicola oligotrophica]NEY89157.1 response regulator [Tabrizicola oligotrophica]